MLLFLITIVSLLVLGVTILAIVRKEFMLLMWCICNLIILALLTNQVQASPTPGYAPACGNLPGLIGDDC